MHKDPERRRACDRARKRHRPGRYNGRPKPPPVTLDAVLAKFRYEGGRLLMLDGREADSCIAMGGYRIANLNGRVTPAHRLIWMLHHGEIPPGMLIDHMNDEKLDNRIENLRLATRAQNCQNCKRHSHNTTGFKGVRREGNAFVSSIKVTTDGVQRSFRLGRFLTAEEAHAAYAKAAFELHGEFARIA